MLARTYVTTRSICPAFKSLRFFTLRGFRIGIGILLGHSCFSSRDMELLGPSQMQRHNCNAAFLCVQSDSESELISIDDILASGF
jgi:hypothetical protein